MVFVDKMLEAARCNRLEEIINLRRVEHTWNSELTNLLASKGFFQTLKWVLQNGCPIDEFTLGYSSRHGHLMCLKLLFDYYKENEVEYNYYFALLNAAEYGHARCLEHLINVMDDTFKRNECKISHYAVQNKQFDCVKILIQNKFYYSLEIILFWLSKYYKDIDLEDVWWREFLFMHILVLKEKFTYLYNLVMIEKENLKMKLNTIKEVTDLSVDVCDYIVAQYL